jgi:hypothetical protein
MALAGVTQPSLSANSPAPVAHHHLYLRSSSSSSCGLLGQTGDIHTLLEDAAPQQGAPGSQVAYAYSAARFGCPRSSSGSAIVPGLSGHSSSMVLTRGTFIPFSSCHTPAPGTAREGFGSSLPPLFASADETTRRPVVWSTTTGEVVWAGEAGPPTPHHTPILCIKAAESPATGTVLGVCSPSALELYVVAPRV